MPLVRFPAKPDRVAVVVYKTPSMSLLKVEGDEPPFSVEKVVRGVESFIGNGFAADPECGTVSNASSRQLRFGDFQFELKRNGEKSFLTVRW